MAFYAIDVAGSHTIPVGHNTLTVVVSPTGCGLSSVSVSPDGGGTVLHNGPRGFVLTLSAPASAQTAIGWMGFLYGPASAPPTYIATTSLTEPGAFDHGDLGGLSDDDHLQYHTDSRGDARYAALGHTHVESDITNLANDLAGKAALSHTHAEADVTSLTSDLAAKQTNIQFQNATVNNGAAGPATVNVTAPLQVGVSGGIATLFIPAAGITNGFLGSGSVDRFKIADQVSTSVLGRAAGTTGTINAIQANADGDILRRTGGTLGFGTIPESSVTNLEADLAARATTADLSAKNPSIAMQDEGGTVANNPTSVNFTGGRVAVTAVGQATTIDVRPAWKFVELHHDATEIGTVANGNNIGGGYFATLTGTGASLASRATNTGDAIGMATLGTGTTATGAVAITTSLSTIRLGSPTVVYKTRVQPQSLSTSAQRYTLRAGLIDSVSGESTDGVFFRYTDNINSGNWQCVNRSNGSETVVANTTVPPSTVALQDLEIRITGTTATFFIAGVQQGSPTSTNVPTGSGRETGAGLFVLASVGTANKPIDYDYVYVSFDLAGLRA